MVGFGVRFPNPWIFACKSLGDDYTPPFRKYTIDQRVLKFQEDVMKWIKWIRKNRQLLMTVLVIGCMVTFVGGYGFQQLLMYMGHGGNETFATYDNGKKITNTEMVAARQELEILTAIQANMFLFNKPTMTGSPDINARLLGYLLFGDAQIGASLRNELSQNAQQGRTPVSLADIDTFFNKEQERPEVMWILLSAETRKAGIAVSLAQSATILRQLIPQMTRNQMDAAAYIHRVATQMNLTDGQILAAFGKMVGILKWADGVCGNENVTLAETRAVIGRNMERIDVEFARFPAEWFIDRQSEPTAQQIQTQFDTYKEFLPDQFSEQNPYGFGYNLPARVQLEYFYVKNDDVKQRIEKPTAEAMEEYYSGNIDQFRSSRPKDPNNPEGEKITETRSFAEVSSQIYTALEQQRSEKLSQLIFKDAKDMLDTSLISLDMEKASNEQLHQASIDFPTVAAKLTEKYKVPLHTGKTGLLCPADFANDSGLRSLQITHAGMQTPLPDAVFAINPQNATAHKKLGVYIPRLWENIGPMAGGFYSKKDFSVTSITAICRVIDAQKSDVPTASDITYSIAGMNSSDQNETNVFNLKQQIIDDLKTVQAMETAKARAEELKQFIAKTDWDKAVEKYNSAYAPKDPNSVPEKAFRKLDVIPLKQQVLAAESDINQIRGMMRDNPISAGFLQSRIVSNMLNRRFFDLLADKTQTDTAPRIVEFTPGAAYYVVKNVTPKPATAEKYQQNKPYAAMRSSLNSAASLGFVYFDPQNIQKRLNYILLKKPELTRTPTEE
jgi:hypothetical protein